MYRKPYCFLIGFCIAFSGNAWAQEFRAERQHGTLPELLVRLKTPNFDHANQSTSSTVQGLPLIWNPLQSVLMRNDGSLAILDADNISHHETLDQTYAPLSPDQLGATLLQSFHGRYEYATFGNYVVIAPRGHARRWAKQFYEMQQAFIGFFAKRNWRLADSGLPQIAMVFASQTEFVERCNAMGLQIASSTLGCYDPDSNRILLYDVPNSRWQDTEATILHESTHQLSFNLGLHNRLNKTPLWIAEGLASVLEVPEVLVAQKNSTLSEAMAMNQPRLHTWNRVAENPQALANWFEELVANDRLFRAYPDECYAISWAITYYLLERDQSAYMNYLQAIASRPQAKGYSATQRSNDANRLLGSPSDLARRAIRHLQASQEHMP